MEMNHDGKCWFSIKKFRSNAFSCYIKLIFASLLSCKILITFITPRCLPSKKQTKAELTELECFYSVAELIALSKLVVSLIPDQAD